MVVPTLNQSIPNHHLCTHHPWGLPRISDLKMVFKALVVIDLDLCSQERKPRFSGKKKVQNTKQLQAFMSINFT